MSDAGSRRDIELRIRAQDLTTADFKNVSAAIKELTKDLEAQVAAANKAQVSERELTATLTKLDQAAKALVNIQGLIDTFKRMPAAISAAEASVAAAGQKLSDYRQQLETTGTTSARAEAQLARLVNALSREEAQLAKNRQAYSDLSATLQKSGVDTERLVQAESDLRSVADLAGASITRLSAAKLDLTKNIRLAREETARLAQEQRAAATAAEALSARFTQEAAAAKQQANVTEQLRAAQQKQVADLRAFNEQTRALTRQHNEDQTRAARDAVNQLRQGQAAAPEAAAGARGAAASATLFGLRPYELQNLSYQVNDIISGIAMGQRATQILAQQGGQVLQLFNRNLFDLVKFLPQIAVGATVAAVAFGALVRAFENVNAIRQFSAAITLNADGARYNAIQLAELQKRIQDLGVSWTDSGKAIREALTAGIAPGNLELFIKTARNLSIVTGETFPEAMKKLVTAFGLGWEAIVRFDRAENFLTETQYRELKALADAGGSREAALRALKIYEAAVQEAADKAQTPFNKAVIEAGVAWRKMLDAFAATGAIQGAVIGLTNLFTKITEVLRTLERLSDYIANNPNLQRLLSIAGGVSDFALSPAATVNNLMTKVTGFDPQSYGRSTTGNAKVVQDWLVEHGYSPSATAAIMGNISVESSFDPAARNKTGHFGLPQWDTERQAPLGGSTDIATQMELLDKELSKLDPAFKTAADSAGVLAARFEKVFERSGGQLLDKRITAAEGYAKGVPVASAAIPTTGGGDTDLTGRRQADAKATVDVLKEMNDEYIRRNTVNREGLIDLEKERAAREAIAKGVKDDDISVELAKQFAEDKLRAQFAETDRRRADEDSKRFIQDGKNGVAIREAGIAARQREIELQKQLNVGLDDEKIRSAFLRGEDEARAKFAKDEQYAAEKKTITNQLAALDRQNSLKDASSLDRALQGVNDQYTAAIQNLDKIDKDFPQRKAENDILRQKLDLLKQVAVARATVNSYEAAAKEALATRTALIDSYKNLAASGDITIGEQERKTKEAFDLTRGAIVGAADKLEAFLKTAEGLALPAEKIALLTAKIAEFRSQAQYVSPLFTAIKGAIENAFTTGLSTAFNTVTSAVGGLIAGTQRWKDVLMATRTAALQFFADLLKSIAEAILKYEALKLASSLFGIGGGGGSSGGGIGGILGSLFGGGSASGIAAGTGMGAGINTQLATGITSDIAGGGVAAGGFNFLSLFGLHSGGVVGRDGTPRVGLSSWFANAPRYHTGSVVGLAPDEQAAILQRGEEILSRSSPRNIMNGGGSSKQDLNIRNILVMDESGIPAAMAGSHGERVTMSHITRNIATIRQYVKG